MSVTPRHSLIALLALLIGLNLRPMLAAVGLLQLIVTLDHAQSPAQAGALLSFVQGGGYTLAALMPLLAGVIRDSMASLE